MVCPVTAIVFAPSFYVIHQYVQYTLTEEHKASQRRREELRAELDYELMRELLVCKATAPMPKLSALPPKRRTAYLFYRDLKAKVCRPFAS